MANYGEELVYWYLRLNGFFPITNYVVHQSPSDSSNSDADVLAVRFPHVCEDVGGWQEDWDPELKNLVDFDLMLGLVCEVKTGKRYNETEIFPRKNVAQSIKRLGFFRNVSLPIAALYHNAVYTSMDQSQIAKLLVANHPPESEAYLFLSVAHVRGFIKQRLAKYKRAKYSARLLFPSVMLQEMIAEIEEL